MFVDVGVSDGFCGFVVYDGTRIGVNKSSFLCKSNQEPAASLGCDPHLAPRGLTEIGLQPALDVRRMFPNLLLTVNMNAFHIILHWRFLCKRFSTSA